MAFGFALENLAKGIIVCRDPSLVSRDRLKRWHGKVSRQLKGVSPAAEGQKVRRFCASSPNGGIFATLQT